MLCFGHPVKSAIRPPRQSPRYRRRRIPGLLLRTHQTCFTPLFVFFVIPSRASSREPGIQSSTQGCISVSRFARPGMTALKHFSVLDKSEIIRNVVIEHTCLGITRLGQPIHAARAGHPPCDILPRSTRVPAHGRARLPPRTNPPDSSNGCEPMSNDGTDNATNPINSPSI